MTFGSVEVDNVEVDNVDVDNVEVDNVEVDNAEVDNGDVGRPAEGGFDHRDPGTAEQAWASSGVWEGLRAVDLSTVAALVVVAAHPDDETLGAGGLIADAAARGIPVTVVVASAGEASHPDSPTVTPARLAQTRRVEVRAAVARLAPAAVVQQLDVPDGALASSVDRLSHQIETAVAGVRGTLLVAPWRADRHPDHAAAADAARRVAADTGCRLLEYPVWAWHWARPGDGTLRSEMLIGHQLSGTAVRAKEMAVTEFRSQLEPLSSAAGDEAVVGEQFLAHFRRTVEVFVAAPGASLDRAYFDDFYAGGLDRWGFETHWYEKRKRALTVASLPRERYASAFEPGCAIGVLTADLAQRCDRLLATDIAAAPLERARRRLAGATHVVLQQLRVPQQWPTGPFDLVVLSEMGYYCNSPDLSVLIARAVASLTPDGVLLACHWRHPVADYPLSGDEVHDRLRRESGLRLLAEHVEEDFRLDVLVRPQAKSVARLQGLVG